jgi:hypothetical protein
MQHGGQCASCVPDFISLLRDPDRNGPLTVGQFGSPFKPAIGGGLRDPSGFVLQCATSVHHTLARQPLLHRYEE